MNFTNITNFGNFSKYDMYLNKPTEIYLGDVVRDVCQQIDEKIIICLLIIYTFYVLRYFVLPYSRFYFETTLMKDAMKKFLDMFEDMLETLSLMATFFIMGLVWYQGMAMKFKIWIIGLLVFSVLVKLFELQDRKRRKLTE